MSAMGIMTQKNSMLSAHPKQNDFKSLWKQQAGGLKGVSSSLGLALELTSGGSGWHQIRMRL